jgi:type I restriction enzyme M protein
LNKNKPQERKEKILFINASKEYIPHPEVKRLNTLSEENIKRISNVYREFKEEEGFSKIVELTKVKKNDYNLNVTLYVHPVEEEEKIDLHEEYQKLKELHREYLEKFKLVEGYIEEALKVIDELL